MSKTILKMLADLKHRADMFKMGRHGETGLYVADALHQRFCRLRHLLPLHIVQQAALLAAGQVP